MELTENKIIMENLYAKFCYIQGKLESINSKSQCEKWENVGI